MTEYGLGREYRGKLQLFGANPDLGNNISSQSFIFQMKGIGKVLGTCGKKSIIILFGKEAHA